jgi:phosphotriesterase-related protein
MWTSNKSNGIIGNFDEVLAEVMEFKKRGGGAIVDVSSIGLGRDPKALFRLSNASGLNIIMGASWYVNDYHPAYMSQKSVDELADMVVRDIVVGVDGTNIRSGVIGEIGVACGKGQMTESELKSTRASARASRITGAPMSFHCGGYREEKFKILDIVESEGVKLSSVIMGHSNSSTLDLEFMKRLLARGVYVEFDYLGAPGWMDEHYDGQVVRGMVEMIKMGFADRILLSHDVCTKVQLKKYGGMGYSFVSDHFLAVLREMGVSEEDIHKVMVDNPAKAFAFVAPKP